MRRRKNPYQNRIQEQRQNRDLTQEELAKLLGTNQRVVSKYEKGERLPSLVTFLKLAAILNTPALAPFYYPELDRECRTEMMRRRKELDIQLNY